MDVWLRPGQVRVFAPTYIASVFQGLVSYSPPPKKYIWFPKAFDDVWNVLGHSGMWEWSSLAWSKS